MSADVIIQNGTIQQFDYDASIMAAALWQHSQAPNILALLQSKQDFFDANQSEFWSDFYTNIFNLETANDFGLSVWSIILGAPIKYNLAGAGEKGWGFGPYRFNFTNGNFASNTGNTYALSTATARIVLQLRYYQLTGSCCIPDINRALKNIFRDMGNSWLVDNLDMTQTYFFDFPLASDLKFAFTNFDVLPRPAGVGSTYIVLTEAPWGFNSDASNFDNSNFYGS